MNARQCPASLRQLRAPLVARVARPLPREPVPYDVPERYDPETQLIEEGRYFMGSPKANTFSARFTLLGRDKQYHDDTKEKSA